MGKVSSDDLPRARLQHWLRALGAPICLISRVSGFQWPCWSDAEAEFVSVGRVGLKASGLDGPGCLM